MQCDNRYRKINGYGHTSAPYWLQLFYTLAFIFLNTSWNVTHKLTYVFIQHEAALPLLLLAIYFDEYNIFFSFITAQMCQCSHITFAFTSHHWNTYYGKSILNMKQNYNSRTCVCFHINIMYTNIYQYFNCLSGLKRLNIWFNSLINCIVSSFRNIP